MVFFRGLVSLVDLGILIWVIYAFIKEYRKGGDEVVIIASVAALVLANIFLVLRSRGTSWLSLYWKRRRMEERVRIKKLTKVEEK